MMPTMFRLAKKIAISKKDKRGFLVGAVAIRKDGTIVKACNSPHMGESQNPKAHAEYKLAKKLDKYAVVYVLRVRRGDGSVGLAKPCPDCERTLRSKKVTKVFYSISDNEYGVLDLTK
jgi:hypothetical protein